MKQKNWEIILFGHKNEVFEFIENLDPATQAKVYRLLEKLPQYGYRLGMPFTKQVNSDLYELRVLGKVQVRLFYIFDYKSIIILHAFIKKTQKLPKKELKIALDRLKQL